MNQSKYVRNAFNLGQEMFGDQARAETARLLDLSMVDQEAVSQLMNYKHETGKPIRTAESRFPAVRFVGSRDGFALIGLGDEGVDLVNKLSLPIASSWSIRLGRAVLQSVSSGDVEARLLPYSLRYSIKRMVIQKRKSQETSINSDPVSHIEKMIKAKILSQAEFFGENIEALSEGLRIHVQETKSLSPVRLSSHCGGFVASSSVVFDANIKLDGPWFAGYFNARGYGRISPVFLAPTKGGDV